MKGIYSESDDQVRQNLAPDLIPLFNRVRKQIKASMHVSRTEAFQEYVEAHPKDKDEILCENADFKLNSLLRPLLDFYETPSWCVRAILPYLPVSRKTRILDAGCGTGAIIRELVKVWPDNEISGIEKEDGRFEEARRSLFDVRQGNFLHVTDRVDLIVSNPPYSHAIDFVQHAMTLAPVVCMLLRLPWLASQKRATWHREHPAHVYVLPRRPSFTGDKRTDATEYAWFLWGACEPGRWTILDVEKAEGKAEIPF